MRSDTKTERNKELVRLRNEGKSYRDLAKIFNISHVVAWKLYQKYKDVYPQKEE